MAELEESPILGKSEYRFCGRAAPGDNVTSVPSNRPGNVRDGIFVTINVFFRTMGCIQVSDRAAEIPETRSDMESCVSSRVIISFHRFTNIAS